MAKANIGKLLLTGVVGGAIALGGSAIYQSTTNQLEMLTAQIRLAQRLVMFR